MRSNLGVGMPIDILMCAARCLRRRGRSPHRARRTLFPRSPRALVVGAARRAPGDSPPALRALTAAPTRPAHARSARIGHSKPATSEGENHGRQSRTGHRRRHRRRPGRRAWRSPRTGYAVVLAGRRQEPLDATASRGEAPGARRSPSPPMSASPIVRRCSRDAKRAFGRLDVLFNNAGTGAPPRADGGPHVRAVEARWSTSTSPAPSSAPRQAFRMMKAQTPRGGRIINNGSISAHTPRPNSAPYTATKHAITGLTKSTALDGRAFDIACGQIDIGNAATPMTGADGRRRAAGRRQLAAEPRMDADARRPRGASTWRACRSTPTCCS